MNIQSLILSGDIDLLFERMFDVHRPLLVETRLDADDGLERTALLKIQRTARTLPVDRRGWQIICNRIHFEWRNDEILIPDSDVDVVSSGKIRLVREHICVTPGYTLLKHRDPSSIDFPQWPKKGHHLVTRDWPECINERRGNATYNCWTKLPPFPAALRSRTMTSAGMSRVESPPGGDRYENQTELFWGMIEDDFGIKASAAIETSRYMKKNLQSIVLDNLKGQW
jgi:hypothetical protein